MERPASLLNQEAAARLAAWYRENSRDLPFRKSRNPYHIWVSEVMLQQTRVTAMLPAFERFIERFPDLQSLAEAELNEVLGRWKGLGYYQRARNLHKAARQMRDEGLMEPPLEYDRLLGFAGIGRYTAAAIASIAGDKMHAVLDGNVKRVLSRLLNREEKESVLQKHADEFLVRSGQRPSILNQAMMELGAIVCVPGKPDCKACPLLEHCLAFAAGGAEHAAGLPVSRRSASIPLHVQVFVHRRVVDGQCQYALAGNADGPFLKEELTFPYTAAEQGRYRYRSAILPDTDRPSFRAGSFRHSITKWRIQCEVFLREEELDGALWVAEDAIENRLHSSFSGKVLELVRKASDGAYDSTATHQARGVKQSRNLKTKQEELDQKEQYHQPKRKGHPDAVYHPGIGKKRDHLTKDQGKKKGNR